MADQEKKAQWIMHLTVCLCGILILGKAVQAKLEDYARPGQYMLHRAVAFLAEEAGQLFLPAVTATEELWGRWQRSLAGQGKVNRTAI